MFKSTMKLAGAGALALGLLAAGSVLNDRGGIFTVDDLLKVGREYIPMRSPAKAAQGSGCMPTTGTVSGLSFAQDVNAGIAALISSNSGSSAPATDCTAAPVKGQVWLDTSTTPNVLRQYDGASWVFLGAVDASNHLWAPPIGGGTATIASATTTDIWANVAASVTISGTTGVTALANADAVPGTMKIVTASGIFTMTNSASLVLPSGANITTAVGDKFLAVALTSTNVGVFAYTKVDGSSLVNPSVPLGTVMYGDYGTIPPKTVYGAGQALTRTSYPAYLAAVTRAQSATLTAGNNTVTSVANTAGLGAGMPLEGTGIQSGTVISSVTSSTIVMSKTATANGSQTVTAFITGYGSGGDSTTVGVKDCQNRVVAGRDGTLGTLTNRLTTSYFGANSAVINIPGGGESQTLAASQLPANIPHNLSVSALAPSGFSILLSQGNTLQGGGVGGSQGAVLPSGGVGSLSTSISGSINNSGGGNPHSIVQPTVTAECVVVVLP